MMVLAVRDLLQRVSENASLSGQKRSREELTSAAEEPDRDALQTTPSPSSQDAPVSPPPMRSDVEEDGSC